MPIPGPFDGGPDAELPVYVDDPCPAGTARSRRRRSRGERCAPGPYVTLLAALARTSAASPCFARMVPVPGDRLALVVADWWCEHAIDGRAVLDGGLLVSWPDVDGDLWSFPGQLRWVGGRRSLPVAIDLWPHSIAFTRMTMTPRDAAITSRRYFHVGHAVLDSLSRQLVGRAASLPD